MRSASGSPKVVKGASAASAVMRASLPNAAAQTVRPSLPERRPVALGRGLRCRPPGELARPQYACCAKTGTGFGITYQLCQDLAKLLVVAGRKVPCDVAAHLR